MKKERTIRMSTKIALLTGMAALFSLNAASQDGGLTTEPREVTFTSTDQSHAIKVLSNGQPIAASRVSQAKVMVEQHDYDHMFDVTKSGETLTISPTDKVEVGSYELRLQTDIGTVTANIYAPLSDLESILAERAKELGVTVAQVKTMMGLSTPATRERLSIDLPPVYYLGQTLSLPMPTASDREFVWKVDGKTVQFGEGPHVFEYTFLDNGYYSISYTERAKGVAVAGDTAMVQVIPEPAVEMNITPGTPVAFQGPPAYASYSWKVDGDIVSRNETYRQTFNNAGTYAVECIARTPEAGLEEEFRKITYEVIVSD